MTRILSILAVLLLVVAAGVGATLVYSGAVRLPWAARPAAPAADAPLPQGMVRIVLSARPIPAYAAITRDDLIDPNTGKLVTVVRTREAAERDGFFTDATLDGLIGRVIRTNKDPGHGFREAEFYPPGTTPGEAAGVPPGKLAVTLDPTKVLGLRGLRPGDHIDLVAARSIDPPKMGGPGGLPMFPGRADPAAYAAVTAKQAVAQTLARDAVVVTPVQTHEVPYMSGGSLTSAGQQRTRPVEEIVVAVAPGELSGLMQAIEVGSTVSAAVRSGQPTAAPPDADASAGAAVPPPGMSFVEKIVGGRHEMVVVGGGSPRPAGGATAGAGGASK